MSQRHSVYHVNILFLIVMLLQMLNFWLVSMPQYPRLILNEALLVLLPSLLYLRWADLPFRETVRLRNPGWRTALASLAIGAGLYPISILLGSIVQMLLDYKLGGTEALLPQTPFEGVLAITAYAVMAPVCEEIFARGIIQRTYEDRFGPRKAILLAGGLFIMFHLSLLQGLIIVPLSLALGYVYWRSGSLVASILTHFGANAMAALVISSNVFWQDAPSVIVSPLGMGVGLLVAAGGLWLLTRSTKPASVAEEKPEPPAKGLRQAWPLVIASLLYLVVIGTEFTAGRFPERFLDPIRVGAAHVEQNPQWRYEVRNIANEPVAEVSCRLEEEGDAIVWLWESTHQAYDVEIHGGRYMGGNVTKQETVYFRQVDGQPLQGRLWANLEHERSETEWIFDGERFVINHNSSQRPAEDFKVAIEQDGRLVLDSSSWPWVLRSLPFSPGYSGTSYYLRPFTWRQATGDSGPVLESILVSVAGPETLETPLGTLQAWKVTLGQETAWYSVEAPHVLLKHHNGFETMVLVEDTLESATIN